MSKYHGYAFCLQNISPHTLLHQAMFQFLFHVVCHLSILRYKLHHLHEYSYHYHVLYHFSTILRRYHHQHEQVFQSHQLDHSSIHLHTLIHQAKLTGHNHLSLHLTTDQCKSHHLRVFKALVIHVLSFGYYYSHLQMLVLHLAYSTLSSIFRISLVNLLHSIGCHFIDCYFNSTFLVVFFHSSFHFNFHKLPHN